MGYKYAIACQIHSFVWRQIAKYMYKYACHMQNLYQEHIGYIGRKYHILYIHAYIVSMKSNHLTISFLVWPRIWKQEYGKDLNSFAPDILHAHPSICHKSLFGINGFTILAFELRNISKVCRISVKALYTYQTLHNQLIVWICNSSKQRERSAWGQWQREGIGASPWWSKFSEQH